MYTQCSGYTEEKFSLFLYFISVFIENLPIVVGKSLTCSDRNYWIAYNEPTNFCQAQGGWMYIIDAKLLYKTILPQFYF